MLIDFILPRLMRAKEFYLTFHFILTLLQFNESKIKRKLVLIFICNLRSWVYWWFHFLSLFNFFSCELKKNIWKKCEKETYFKCLCNGCTIQNPLQNCWIRFIETICSIWFGILECLWKKKMRKKQRFKIVNNEYYLYTDSFAIIF